MTMCILFLGNYLKYIPLSVPFSIPPYVASKMLGPPPQGNDIEVYITVLFLHFLMSCSLYLQISEKNINFYFLMFLLLIPEWFAKHQQWSFRWIVDMCSFQSTEGYYYNYKLFL